MFQRATALSKESYRIFSNNRAGSRGAAIAFYTVTSIAPILLIVIAVAGLALGRDAASGAVFAQFRSLLGAEGADFVQKAIASASSKSAGIAASTISIVTLLATVSGVFLELEDALNSIWEAKPEGGFLNMARARVASVGLVIALGFLLLVSLVIDAGLKGLSGFIDSFLPFGSVVLIVLSLLVSFVLVSVLFAAIFKFLPAKQIAWREVIWGAAFTGLLFEVGKFLIGLYLGSSATLSSLGAAGALLALLFWVYYSAQILLFGASFTRAFAETSTSKAISPVVVTEKKKAVANGAIPSRAAQPNRNSGMPLATVIALLAARTAALVLLRRSSKRRSTA
jgi:membrane protein